MKNAEVQALALEFKNDNPTRSRQNYIVQAISQKYYNKARKMVGTVAERDKEDVWQIYYMFIHRALVNWKQGALFSTYLYAYVRGCVREYNETNRRDAYKNALWAYVDPGIMEDATRDKSGGAPGEYCYWDRVESSPVDPTDEVEAYVRELHPNYREPVVFRVKKPQRHI